MPSSIYELTSEDKEQSKLRERIKEGKGIAKKFKDGAFKKSSYDAKKALTTKITYKDKDGEWTFTLLHYAIRYKNNKAFDDLLQEAVKQKLLKNVLNEETIIKHSNGQEETHTALTYAILCKHYETIREVLEVYEKHGILGNIFNKKATIKFSSGKEETHTTLTYAILCKNYETIREVLEVSEKQGILEDILNKKVTIKYPDGQEETHTTLDYANVDSETAEIFKEFTDSLNITDIDHQETMPTGSAIDNTGISTDTELCEDTNENSEDPDIRQPLYESNKEAQTKVTQVAIAGTALLIGSIISYTLKMHTIAVIGGIIGLACIGFALYNVLKPDTKLEEVENAEQLDRKKLLS